MSAATPMPLPRPRRRLWGVASPPVIERSDSEIDFDRLATRWELALDAAQNAIAAAAHAPGVGLDLTHAQHELAQERVSASALLAEAASMHARPAPWLAPGPVTPRQLGLAADVKACLFDLDGVLTDSGLLHAQAWAEVFDSFLLRLAEQVGWQFVPFDPVGDYRSWIDGRPRLEGVHACLASRGIRLPEGKREDPADAETAQGLARHKAEVLQRRIA